MSYILPSDLSQGSQVQTQRKDQGPSKQFCEECENLRQNARLRFDTESDVYHRRRRGSRCSPFFFIIVVNVCTHVVKRLIKNAFWNTLIGSDRMYLDVRAHSFNQDKENRSY